MTNSDESFLTMKAPAYKPFFIEIEGLKSTYEEFEYQLLKETGWQWIWLSHPEDISFDQMHFYGLADFFTEIAMSYAYFLALKEKGVTNPEILLFHGNNIILRIVACWDRMGFALNEFLNLGLKDKDVYFDKMIKKARLSCKIPLPIRKKIGQLKRRYDKGGCVRKWRHMYLHRHGEHFEKENEGSLQLEYFPLSQEDKIHTLNYLEELLEPSFSDLKEAMHICSRIFFRYPGSASVAAPQRGV